MLPEREPPSPRVPSQFQGEAGDRITTEFFARGGTDCMRDLTLLTLLSWSRPPLASPPASSFCFQLKTVLKVGPWTI